MNTDLQPFSAFALEQALPARGAVPGHTLTLHLGAAHPAHAEEPMAGVLALRVTQAALPGGVQARVDAAVEAPLTITF